MRLLYGCAAHTPTIFGSIPQTVYLGRGAALPRSKATKARRQRLQRAAACHGAGKLPWPCSAPAPQGSAPCPAPTPPRVCSATCRTLLQDLLQVAMLRKAAYAADADEVVHLTTSAQECLSAAEAQVLCRRSAPAPWPRSPRTGRAARRQRHVRRLARRLRLALSSRRCRAGTTAPARRCCLLQCTMQCTLQMRRRTHSVMSAGG